MYLIIDTETTGFPRKDLPASHSDQARVIQLACLLLDENFKERACFSTLIKPAGWIISSGAQAIHGITIEDCEKYGMPIETALRAFSALYDCSQTLIAHNLKFDHQMLTLEGFLCYSESKFCTMEATTNVCKIPSARGGYKWPKLVEAHRYIFQEELIDAHDALADCRACAKIFKWLKEQELQPAS